MPIRTYRLTDMHGWRWLAVRSAKQMLPKSWLRRSRLSGVRKGAPVYQSRMERGDTPKIYVLRVVVDIDREPSEVVTAYRSSKVQNYWRSDA